MLYILPWSFLVFFSSWFCCPNRIFRWWLATQLVACYLMTQLVLGHVFPSGVLCAGRSIQTSMALPSMPCMPCIAFGLGVPKMLFRERLCARFWHRLGLESCWGSGVSQPCSTMLHRAFPWYWPVIQTSMALPSMPGMPCTCIAFCLAVPKMLFREHLCARFWHRLGLESCWGSGVSQPCPAVLHKAFPWYWPVHPNIYGFAFYALYALYYLLFSSSEDAISRASLRTLLAPPWA